VDLDVVALQVLRRQPREAVIVLDVNDANLGLGGHQRSISPSGPATRCRNIPKQARNQSPAAGGRNAIISPVQALAPRK
jgi:hypothetical protein